MIAAEMSEFLLSFRYAALEDNMEREREETQVEMKRRNDTIRALSKDLEDSKSLIKTLEQRGLTEEGIARLSPAAAAASKLINSGMSLTDVYSQVCQDVLQNFYLIDLGLDVLEISKKRSYLNFPTKKF